MYICIYVYIGARLRAVGSGMGGGGATDIPGRRLLLIFRQHPPGLQVGLFRHDLGLCLHQARAVRPLRGELAHRDMYIYIHIYIYR